LQGCARSGTGFQEMRLSDYNIKLMYCFLKCKLKKNMSCNV
jgi:hypothetical protein